MTVTLVTGGIRSGKSRHAETLASGGSDVTYVATGPLDAGTNADADPEWTRRLALHRERRPSGWSVLETLDVAGVLAVHEGMVVVDCLGTWVTGLVDEAALWDDLDAATELLEAATDLLRDALGDHPRRRGGRDQRGGVRAGRDHAVRPVVPGRARAGQRRARLPGRPGAPRRGRSGARPQRRARRAVTDAVRLAVGTLTRFPTPAPRRVDPTTAGRAMLLAPLTTVPLVVVLLLAHLAVAAGGLPAYLAAVLVLAATAWWSRGLHLDGLADTADGLAAAYDRDRALAVMRRGDVGPTGVVTLVLTLLVQVAALGALLPTRGGCALAAVALLASRAVLALACRAGVPAARPDGLGATVAGSVPTAAAAVIAVVSVAVGAGLAVVTGGAWYAGALVAAAAGVAAIAIVGTAVRRLGGITGDVLGAVVELALAAALAVAAALVSRGVIMS